MALRRVGHCPTDFDLLATNFKISRGVMGDLEEGKRALAMLESWPKDSVTTGLNFHTEPCMRLQ